MKKKNILMLALMAMLLVLAASPAMAFIWGEGLNKYTESVTKQEFGGKWTLDAENKTLTLENITIEADWEYILQPGNNVETIILVGENKLITPSGSPIYSVADRNLTITGSGSLYASGYDNGIVMAVNGYNLSIDGATVHAVAQIDSGIRAFGGVIEITNGAKVTAESVANVRAGSFTVGPNGKLIIRNASTVIANVLVTGSEIYDKSKEYYPILYENAPLTIEDTSSMTLTSVKPFNLGEAVKAKADSMNFSFPGGETNYMTYTKGASKCAHTFDLSETQLENGKYQLTVQGSRLPDHQITHNWGDWTGNGDGTHTRACTDNASHTQSGDCSGGTATATKKAVCSICGGEYGEVNPDNGGEIIVPETGDETNLLLLIALMAISVLGMLSFRRRKA